MNNVGASQRGRELIAEALARPSEFAKANELLSQFFHGLPIEALSELLHCADEHLLAAGLFIVEELGEKVAPLVADVVALTHHKTAGTRLSAYAALTCCIPKETPEAYAGFVRGIHDGDAKCRQYVMFLMMRASDQLLRAAHDAMGAGEPEVELREGLSMLLSEAAQDASQVESWIGSDRPFVRKIGAIAAGRLGITYPGPLALAAASADADVKRSAISLMKFEELRQKIKNRRRKR
jgi:hypothetical protein